MLVPDVLTRTPPYVDSVEADSPADIAGLRADDLVVFVDEEPIVSCRAVHQALGQREYNEEIQLSILRDGSLLEFRMQAPSTSRKMTDGEQLP